MIRKTTTAAATIVIAATLLGCEARASNGALPTRIKSVAVVVIPGTIEPTFARTLERALEDAFAADGTLGVASADAADSKLTIKIVGFKQQPVKYGVDKIVNEYNLTLTLEGTFADLATDQVLFQVPNIYESVSYAAVGPKAETEYEAFQRLAEKIAPRIVKETIVRR